MIFKIQKEIIERLKDEGIPESSTKFRIEIEEKKGQL